MEQQLKNVDLKGNTPSNWPTSTPQNMKPFRESARCTGGGHLSGMLIWKEVNSSILFCISETEAVCDFFLFLLVFTTSESWHADPLSTELNRNVRFVCLASRSTVRVSGGLKSSWGRVVGRHSSVTFLSCYSHQTAFNNQSLFAEIRIGLRLECSRTLSSW